MQIGNRTTTLSMILAAVAFCAFMIPSTAAAEEDFTSGTIGKDDKIGVGFGGGTMASPLTVKFYMSEDTALQLFFGTYFGWGFGLSGDFVLEFASITTANDDSGQEIGELFAGIGGGAGFASGYERGGLYGVGINGVLELGWHFSQFPLEFIIDWRPTFFFGDLNRDFYGIDDTGFIPFGFGGAVRYYF